MRRMSYAYKTENTYCDWVRRFIKFSQMKDKNQLFENAENKVEVFLTIWQLSSMWLHQPKIRRLMPCVSL